MTSFIEVIYIDNEDLARKTGLGLSLATSAEAWAKFRNLRLYGVDIKHPRFLIDYHKANGDLADTIAVDADGFTAITGQQPKTDAEYCKIDADYWDEISRDRQAA